MLCRNHPDVSEGVRRCARCGSPYCSDCVVDISGKPYCATCKGEELLDVRSGVSHGAFDFATIGKRFLAAVVDGFLVWIVLAVLNFAFTFGTAAARINSFGFQILWQFLLWGMAVTYQASMLAARGQTLGKMAVRIKVISADGTELTTGQAWGREIARALLGILCIVDYIPAFFNDQKTTLHDMAAKTRVINWT